MILDVLSVGVLVCAVPGRREGEYRQAGGSRSAEGNARISDMVIC